MTNEIQNYVESNAILMKSGLVHWVTRMTGEKASMHLANQGGHSFMRIAELDNITINTAEIEGVYNHSQYNDLCRVKSGEWQCAYRRWHQKKGECKCKSELAQEEERIRKAKEEEEANKPLTPEEEARRRDAMATMMEHTVLDGRPDSIFRNSFMKGKKDGRIMRMKTVREWEARNGRKADLAGLATDEIINNQTQTKQ